MTEKNMKETLEKQLQLLSERSVQGDSNWVVQVNAIVDAFLGKVREKIRRDDCTTDMLYEDIRMLHHIVRIQDEIRCSLPESSAKDSIR